MFCFSNAGLKGISPFAFVNYAPICTLGLDLKERLLLCESQTYELKKFRHLCECWFSAVIRNKVNNIKLIFVFLFRCAWITFLCWLDCSSLFHVTSMDKQIQFQQPLQLLQHRTRDVKRLKHTLLPRFTVTHIVAMIYRPWSNKFATVVKSDQRQVSRSVLFISKIETQSLWKRCVSSRKSISFKLCPGIYLSLKIYRNHLGLFKYRK